MSETVCTISALSRFPVKSMQGEPLTVAQVTEGGVLGDRAYALVEVDTGKVLSGKTPRLGTQLLGCRAAFVASPRLGDELPPVRITLPDGASVTSDSRDGDATLSKFLGRDVTLQRAAPDDFTIEQYHPDIEDIDPEGHRDTVTETKLGAAAFAQAGVRSFIPAGSFLDVFPVSVLTTSTLAQLQSLRPDSRFDERRFRMSTWRLRTEGSIRSWRKCKPFDRESHRSRCTPDHSAPHLPLGARRGAAHPSRTRAHHARLLLSVMRGSSATVR